VLILAATLWAGAFATAEEPPQLIETARTTVPAVILFEVNDLTSTTQAVSGTTTVAFDTALLGLGRALRISVKADGDLIPPNGVSIPISNIAWSTSGVSNGVGVNGVLSKTTYTQVFQSNVGALSGQVDVTWTLSPPSVGVRAGLHQVTLRWKVESVTP
jgi:hypothetical protein